MVIPIGFYPFSEVSINKLFNINKTIMNYLNEDTMYDLFEYLSPEDIVHQCRSNKQMSNYCRHPLIQRLIAKKRVTKQISDYLEFYGRNKSLQNILNDLLLEKINLGDYYEVEELIKKGANPAVNYNTPIISSSSRGDIDIVELLLSDPRVDPSDRNNQAIRNASNGGYNDVVELLLTDSRVKMI